MNFKLNVYPNKLVGNFLYYGVKLRFHKILLSTEFVLCKQTELFFLRHKVVSQTINNPDVDTGRIIPISFHLVSAHTFLCCLNGKRTADTNIKVFVVIQQEIKSSIIRNEKPIIPFRHPKEFSEYVCFLLDINKTTL
jgi:hypothetical protein